MRGLNKTHLYYYYKSYTPTCGRWKTIVKIQFMVRNPISHRPEHTAESAHPPTHIVKLCSCCLHRIHKNITHTNIYIYIYISVCCFHVCVCVCKYVCLFVINYELRNTDTKKWFRKIYEHNQMGCWDSYQQSYTQFEAGVASRMHEFTHTPMSDRNPIWCFFFFSCGCDGTMLAKK